MKKQNKLTQEKEKFPIVKAVRMLIKNSKYHYQMLVALQQQIICLEAKNKILEEKIKFLIGGR